MTNCPQITIDGKPYYGEADVDSIYDAVCAAFHKTKKPDACLTPLEAMAKIEHISAEIEAIKKHEAVELARRRGVAHHHAALFIFLVVFFNVLLILYCIRKNRRQDKEKMSSSVQ